MTSAPENFVFLMNVGRLIDAPSYTFGPGYVLRRATPDEIAIIKENLERRSTGPVAINHWECARSASGRYERLPEEQWRYYVIAFSEPGAVTDLEWTLDVMPLELEAGFTIHYMDGLGPSVTHDPARLFHFLQDAMTGAAGSSSIFVDVSESDVQAIEAIYKQLRNHDHSLLDLKRPLRTLNDLKRLRYHSWLRFLGYFAVLESLLTHNPKPDDRYDSITRQVKNKLALLDHRWGPRSIDYSPFSGTPANKVWERMYVYRSILAHGGNPNFSSGQLQGIGSSAKALTLLIETTKAVIRHALSEPQLLVDLKET